MSDLRKVVLKKDYAIRHDIIIETGSVIHMGEYKALQLKRNGFLDFEGDSKKIEKEQTTKGRKKVENAPQIVEHVIKDK